MAAGGISPLYSLCTLFLSSLEHRCADGSDCGGVLVFLLSSLEHRCAGSSDCGGVLVYIEPMCIEAPSRGPCIGIIYTHPSRVGGIHPLFPPIQINMDSLLTEY